MMYVLVEPNPTSPVGKTSTFATREDLLKYLMKDNEVGDVAEAVKAKGLLSKIAGILKGYVGGTTQEEQGTSLDSIMATSTAEPLDTYNNVQAVSLKPSDLLPKEVSIPGLGNSFYGFQNISPNEEDSKLAVKQRGKDYIQSYYLEVPKVSSAPLDTGADEECGEENDNESICTQSTINTTVIRDDLTAYIDERRSKAKQFSSVTFHEQFLPDGKTLLGHHYQSMKTLRNWFVDTFCVIKDTELYIPALETEIYNTCCRLFVYAHEFCTRDPSMIDTGIPLPSEIRYVEEYDPESIIKFLQDIKVGALKLSIKQDSFKLYQKLRLSSSNIVLCNSNILSNTIIAFAHGKLTKHTLRDWIFPFVSKRTQHNRGVHTKSSEMYKQWIQYLETIVDSAENEEFKQKVLKLSNIRDFSKEMKNHCKMARRGAGMFYIDTAIVPTNQSSKDEPIPFNSELLNSYCTI